MNTVLHILEQSVGCRTIKHVKLQASLSVLALAAATTAVAQTSTPSTTTPAHHTATAATATKLPKNIPPVHGVLHTAYSLKYIDTKIGTGALAPPMKFYTVQYTGWLASDGKKFDSSLDHPGAAPITFPVGAHRVIPGWDTGFAGMHIGGKRRLFVPYQLAYGEQGRPPVIPPKSDLIFDVELISVSDKPPAPKTPPMTPRIPGAPGSTMTPGAPGAPGMAPKPGAPATPPTSGAPTTPPAGTPPPASAPATPPASTPPATPPPTAPATPPSTPPASSTPPPSQQK
jgi:peptidylprolyl isomerase